MLKIDKRKLKRKLSPSRNHFLSLARSIIYQQISTKAGDSIQARFFKLFGNKKPTPELFLSFSSGQLQAAGVSPQKQRYLKDLADKFLDRTIKPKHFSKMSDAEVKEHLVRIKGVGSWTADMFLIFALNRPDVLPIGDLGIRKGFQKTFGLRKLPSERRMLGLSKEYRGKLTLLSLFLWESLEKN